MTGNAGTSGVTLMLMPYCLSMRESHASRDDTRRRIQAADAKFGRAWADHKMTAKKRGKQGHADLRSHGAVHIRGMMARRGREPNKGQKQKTKDGRQPENCRAKARIRCVLSGRGVVNMAEAIHDG